LIGGALSTGIEGSWVGCVVIKVYPKSLF